MTSVVEVPRVEDAIETRTHGAIDVDDRRYGRLFVAADEPDEATLRQLFDEYRRLGARMVRRTSKSALRIGRTSTRASSAVSRDDDENTAVPALYTYFGQFVAHDLTFDESSSLTLPSDVGGLVNSRTPRLDLDALYGGGPDEQPQLYDGDRFKLGNDITFDERYRPDVPRTDAGVALIGDARNDHHVIISQLTALLLRFHNALVDGLDRGGTRRGFDEAQRLVRWHYQWLIVNDYVLRVVGGRTMAQFVWPPDQATADIGQRLPIWNGRTVGSFMPIEFAAAAFRFGHSMVRPAYAVNGAVAPGTRIPIVGPPRREPDYSSLRGHRALPTKIAVDWSYFAETHEGRARGRARGTPQGSYLIDTQLVEPLTMLDRAQIVRPDDPPASLPERTLRRGALLRLPSGQEVALRLRELGYNDCRVLSARGLGLGKTFPLSSERTPLWYYILKEAELTCGGLRLGPVGGTLVAGVLLGIVAGDAGSYLNAGLDAGWRPSCGANPGRFTVADLVDIAERWQP